MRTHQSTKGFVFALALRVMIVSSAQAQAPGADTLRVLTGIAATVRDSGAVWGSAIWPGFRPDTISLLFVLPARGTVLLNFPGALPDGYLPLPGVPGGGFRTEAYRGAASTATQLGERRAAQVVVNRVDRMNLMGVVLHEAFHVFERSVASKVRRFGSGENSALISSYPAFDVANETGMALEGRILSAALQAHTAAEARALAVSYAAARERRYRALDPTYVEFESMAELNEGLAEYALVRTHERLGERPQASSSIRRLDSLTSAPGLSLRLRFYSTGSGIALLLDRLAPGWKTRLLRDDVTLFEAVARESGLRTVGDQAVQRAEHQFQVTNLRDAAEREVSALRASRARMADSLMSAPGVLIELDGSAQPGKFIGTCGFDPQNMLQVGDGRIIHTRWLKICAASFDGEFNTPVIQGAGNTTMTAVLGHDTEVHLTVSGQPVSLEALTSMVDAKDIRIESSGLTLKVSHGDLSREGRTLRLKPARS